MPVFEVFSALYLRSIFFSKVLFVFLKFSLIAILCFGGMCTSYLTDSFICGDGQMYNNLIYAICYSYRIFEEIAIGVVSGFYEMFNSYQDEQDHEPYYECYINFSKLNLSFLWTIIIII